jgi:hypothetical protein
MDRDVECIYVNIYSIRTLNSFLNDISITGTLSVLASRRRGAVVRAVAQRSDDPYVAGSNPTNVGVGPSDETV